MSNHIRKTTVEIRRLSAAAAEVWFTVEVDVVTPTTELQGRLVGPRCPGVTTIEVAYPVRSVPRWPADPPNTVTAQVIVPEPNLWTEKTPLYYQGILELRQDGERCEVTTIAVRFRGRGH